MAPRLVRRRFVDDHRGRRCYGPPPPLLRSDGPGAPEALDGAILGPSERWREAQVGRALCTGKGRDGGPAEAGSEETEEDEPPPMGCTEQAVPPSGLVERAMRSNPGRRLAVGPVHPSGSRNRPVVLLPRPRFVASSIHQSINRKNEPGPWSRAPIGGSSGRLGLDGGANDVDFDSISTSIRRFFAPWECLPSTAGCPKSAWKRQEREGEDETKRTSAWC